MLLDTEVDTSVNCETENPPVAPSPLPTKASLYKKGQKKT